jgi:hypothetical protein
MSDMNVLMGVLFALWGAVLWRFRGGGFVYVGSTQLVRAVCGVGLAAPLAWLHGWDWLWLAPAIFFGLVLVGWGDFMDMATNLKPKSEELVSPLVRWLGPGTLLHDVVGMTLTGMVMVSLPAIAVGCAGGTWALPLLAGLGLAPAYLLGWRVSSRYPTEVAEAVFGAWFAGLLWVAAGGAG